MATVSMGFALSGFFTTPVTAETVKPNIVLSWLMTSGRTGSTLTGVLPKQHAESRAAHRKRDGGYRRLCRGHGLFADARGLHHRHVAGADRFDHTHSRISGRERPAPKGGPRDVGTLKHLPLDLPSYARELKKQGYATGFL